MNQSLLAWLTKRARRILKSRTARGFAMRLADAEVRRRDTEDQAYFRSLKDKYKGRRGFVIGNGPSLRVSDLDMLVNEITIASNKIYLAFDQVQWRPTVYTIVDRLVWDKTYAQLAAHGLFPTITSYLPTKPIPHHRAHYLGNAVDLFLQGEGYSFSTDMARGLFGGYTVTFENLQIAFHLGVDPIYLVGCDHYYQGEDQDVIPESPVLANTTANHFVPNYRELGERVNPAPIRKMTVAYEIAARVAKKTGRSICNASRYSYLEVFPRSEFEDLFH